jgi:pimeloyl-ACP methyl ester carboxylesterase
MNPIILLHGAIGAKDQLEPLAKELAAKGYQTYSFNFSGHGQTSFQNQFDIKQFAEELKLFIEMNNLVQPDVFGYSMGGYVALYLASQNSNILGRIITLGTKFEWSPAIAQREIKMLDAKIISEKVPKFAEALQKRHGIDWQLLLQRTADMMIDLGNNNLLNPITFSQIKNRVCIGLADGDTMVSSEETDNAASKIVGAGRYTLQNTKHPIETANLNELLHAITNLDK